MRVGVRREEKSAFEISKSDLARAGIQLECGQRKCDAAMMAAERDRPNNLAWQARRKNPAWTVPAYPRATAAVGSSQR